MQIQKISAENTNYPKQLGILNNPPETLYYRGNLDALKYKHAVAIVGTRRCSEYGREATRKITKELAQAGITIISGLAAGIDTEAHKTALELGAPTIAILGTGLDDKVIYPQRNLNLARKIIEQGGLLLSEHKSDTEVFKSNFPKRNRIVAALSDAVIVTEAPLKSGALITAGFAKKYNKKVFAVPGNIFSRLSFGTNQLIENGANAVTGGDIILEKLGIKKAKQSENLYLDLDESEQKILKLIKDSSELVHIDKIIQKVNLNSNEVSIAITSLILNDLIKETGPNCYIAS